MGYEVSEANMQLGLVLKQRDIGVMILIWLVLMLMLMIIHQKKTLSLLPSLPLQFFFGVILKLEFKAKLCFCKAALWTPVFNKNRRVEIRIR